jgi:putative ABC transport system permease protein
METILQDIRYSLRALKRTPAFTAASVIVLALGIGASTSIFTVVNAVLLRPLPYPESDRLVMLWETNPRFQIAGDALPVTPGSFMDWREENSSFEQVAAFGSSQLNLSGGGEPERVACASVSANFFALMRVAPMLGRGFDDADEKPGAVRVAVISYALWQRRLAGAADAIGKSLTLDGETYSIAGVAPEGFQFPRARELPYSTGVATNTDVWKPMTLTDEFITRKRANHQLSVLARLKAGVTLEQARTDIKAIAARAEQDIPDSKGIGVKLVPLAEQVIGNVRTGLLVLAGAIGLVMLIACANVANLMLARAAARTKEIAIRSALGASRFRIIRQLATEAMLVGLASGLAGFVLSLWGVKSLVTLGGSNLPRTNEIAVDFRVVAVTFGMALLSSVLFGLLPAIGASKVNLSKSLKQAATQGTFHRNRLRGALVVAEIAISLVLLIGSGLMIRSLARVLAVDPGFKPDQTLTLRLALAGSKYPNASQQIAFFQDVNRRVAAIPGMQSAGLISSAPLGGGLYAGGFSIESQPATPEAQDQTADRRMVSPEYFKALGIPLIEGRAFDDRDDQNSAGVAIVSESLARRFLPNEDAIGKRIKLGGRDSTRPWLSIVGICGDVRDTVLESDARPCVYVPYPQFAVSSMTLVARTAVDPKTLVTAIREEVWAVDKDQPITDVKTMSAYVSDSVAPRRSNAILLGAFAAVALVLASVGVYGVIAYSVTQRVREIGIRIALGAESGDVIKLIVGRGLALVTAGVVIGLAGALALTRVMSSLLYGVRATDPITFALVTLLLIGVAVLASYIPARRAARVDPMVALRNE